MSDWMAEQKAEQASLRAAMDGRIAAFMKALRSRLKELGLKATGDDHIHIGDFTSSLRIKYQSGSGARWRINWTGKLSLSFGRRSSKAYPEPKAGYDPQLWAERIKEEYEAEIASKENGERLKAKEEVVKQWANRLQEKYGGYIYSTHNGIQLSFSGLSEEQAEAILEAARKVEAA